MEINKITEKILYCAFKVHSELGPGLFEKAYEECLYFELLRNGIKTERQKPMPLIYCDIDMEMGYRVDLLVEDSVVVELKTVECFNKVHFAQIMTYLKLSKCKIGLLLNFNVASMRQGIKRIAM